MSGNRRRLILIAGLAAASEAAAVWIRGQKPGGSVVVRCSQGHVFTTIWIPGASIKSLRLGFWRVQYCPVGHHWTIVTPVNEAELSAEDRRAAHERHDIRIP